MLHNSDNEWCSDDDWSKDDDNDDWETVNIPNLIINNEQEKIKLEERKLVEEADAILAKELFLDKKLEEERNKLKEESNKLKEESNKQKEPSKLETNKQNKQKESTIDMLERKNRRKKHVEMQRQEAQKIKKQKEERLRQKELYGEADVDEYDEKYGGIEDRY